MRGSVKQMKRKGHWTLRFDVYEVNPATGRPVRKRQWIAYTGTKAQAESKLADCIAKVSTGDFIEPSKLRLRQWLDAWMDRAIRGRRAMSTVNGYDRMITGCIGPKLGSIPLQALRPLDLEGYYAGLAKVGSPRALCRSATRC